MGNNVEVSEPILEAMRREAQASGQEVNGLFEEAAEQLLAHRHIDDLARRGEGYARQLGRKPSDAVRLVREDRRQRGR
jgi:hypothetical protein